MTRGPPRSASTSRSLAAIGSNGNWRPAARRGDNEDLLPVQRAYQQAVELAARDPEAALARLEALLAVFNLPDEPDTTDLEKTTRQHTLELAHQQIESPWSRSPSAPLPRTKRSSKDSSNARTTWRAAIGLQPRQSGAALSRCIKARLGPSPISSRPTRI